MIISDLFETIHDDGNLDLISYFEEHPVDMGDDRMREYWDHFISIINDDSKAKLLKFFGLTDVRDIDASFYYDLPPKAKRQFADWLESINAPAFFIHEDPHSTPAWMLMDPITGKLLPKNTPLIHFSDHAAQIKIQGFTQGVPELANIALTREHNIYDIFDATGSSGR